MDFGQLECAITFHLAPDSEMRLLKVSENTAYFAPIEPYQPPLGLFQQPARCIWSR